jgi:hypothetical protein
MRTALALLVAALAIGAGGAREAAATHELTFAARLVGGDEVPSNGSTARGTAIAVLEADGRVTYAVNSSGFDTSYRVAHVHLGSSGVAGPIMFPIDCNEKGTACSGTSRPLEASERAALEAGGTYVNLHTDQFPTGEIRGQLRSVIGTPPIATNIIRYAGKASGVGVTKGSEVKIKGRFSTTEPLDLATATASILVLLAEPQGAGELVTNRGGQPILSIALGQPRPDDRGKEAVLSSVLSGGDPLCRLKVKRVDDDLYEHELQCKRGEGAMIPGRPTLCSADRYPKTSLRTWIVLSAGTSIGVDLTQPWRCLGRNGNVRELKAVELKSTGTPVTPGPGPQENEQPTADFRADVRSGRAPLTVVFENRSTDRDGDALTYQWSFGDGQSSTEKDPTHVYTTAGKFDVQLVVKDARGAVSDPKEMDIEVDPAS